MTRYNKDWNEEEIEILKQHYEKSRINVLCDMLEGRTWQSISGKAKRLGIKRLPRFSYERMGDLSPLLDETCESFYWLGFILADGHLRPPGGFSMNLSVKDKGHLEKLSKFFNYKKELRKSIQHSYEIYVMSFCDPDNFDELVDKFSISQTKTYNPPDFYEYDFSDDLMFSLIIGFIDGDGWMNHTRSGSQLGIVSHIKWKNNLEFIKEFLYRYCCFSNKMKKPSIYIKENKCVLQISNLYNIINMKNKAIDLGLDRIYLKRKWDRIDINHENPVTKLSRERMEKALKMKQGKCHVSEIAKELGMSVPGVYNILSRAKKTAVCT